LLGAEKIEEIVFMNAIGPVCGTDSSEGFRKFVIERARGGGWLGLKAQANLAAKAGELDARRVDGSERYCRYGGQNSSR
jgi:hypothetical protein